MSQTEGIGIFTFICLLFPRLMKTSQKASKASEQLIEAFLWHYGGFLSLHFNSRCCWSLTELCVVQAPSCSHVVWRLLIQSQDESQQGPSSFPLDSWPVWPMRRLLKIRQFFVLSVLDIVLAFCWRKARFPNMTQSMFFLWMTLFESKSGGKKIHLRKLEVIHGVGGGR